MSDAAEAELANENNGDFLDSETIDELLGLSDRVRDLTD